MSEQHVREAIYYVSGLVRGLAEREDPHVLVRVLGPELAAGLANFSFDLDKRLGAIEPQSGSRRAKQQLAPIAGLIAELQSVPLDALEGFGEDPFVFERMFTVGRQLREGLDDLAKRRETG